VLVVATGAGVATGVGAGAATGVGAGVSTTGTTTSALAAGAFFTGVFLSAGILFELTLDFEPDISNAYYD